MGIRISRNRANAVSPHHHTEIHNSHPPSFLVRFGGLDLRSPRRQVYFSTVQVQFIRVEWRKKREERRQRLLFLTADQLSQNTAGTLQLGICGGQKWEVETLKAYEN